MQLPKTPRLSEQAYAVDAFHNLRATVRTLVRMNRRYGGADRKDLRVARDIAASARFFFRAARSHAPDAGDRA